MTVTPASLVLAYPQWDQVNTAYPDVVTTAISQGVHRINEASAGDQFDEMVMLAASSWLYDQAYARDLRKPNDASANPYEIRLVKMMGLKGSAHRTLWTESDFGDT